MDKNILEKLDNLERKFNYLNWKINLLLSTNWFLDILIKDLKTSPENFKALCEKEYELYVLKNKGEKDE